MKHSIHVKELKMINGFTRSQTVSKLAKCIRMLQDATTISSSNNKTSQSRKKKINV